MNAAALDDITREAMRDSATFAQLVQQVGPDKVRASLIRMRNDVGQQNFIQQERRIAGDLTKQELHEWKIRSASFVRALNRRIGQIEADQDPDDRAYYRNIVVRMALAIDRYLDDEDVPEAVLEELLDIKIPFGESQEPKALADAITDGVIAIKNAAGQG